MPFGPDDDMIMNGDAKPLTRLGNLTRQGDVSAARRWITAWVIMNKDDCA